MALADILAEAEDMISKSANGILPLWMRTRLLEATGQEWPGDDDDLRRSILDYLVSYYEALPPWESLVKDEDDRRFPRLILAICEAAIDYRFKDDNKLYYSKIHEIYELINVTYKNNYQYFHFKVNDYNIYNPNVFARDLLGNASGGCESLVGYYAECFGAAALAPFATWRASDLAVRGLGKIFKNWRGVKIQSAAQVEDDNDDPWSWDVHYCCSLIAAESRDPKNPKNPVALKDYWLRWVRKYINIINCEVKQLFEIFKSINFESAQVLTYFINQSPSGDRDRGKGRGA